MTKRMFDEQTARLPDNYPWTQDFINAMWHGFWTPNEFSFTSDRSQFLSEMSDEERQVMVRTLSAIGQIEIAVKRFWADLGNNLPHPSLSDLGLVMANTEVIHNQAYEKLLKVLGLEDIFEENLSHPVIANRVEYLRKYNKKVYADDRKQYIYSIVLFTLFIENVSLFSQFFTVLWFNRFKNVMKDTAQQVAYTRNEELLHAQIGIKIINTLREEYPELFDLELENRIQEECQVAIQAEKELIQWMIGPYEGEGLDQDILNYFIGSRLNDCMEAAGFTKPLILLTDHSAQTEWFDVELIGNNHVDFFHSKSVNYGKSNKTYDAKDVF